MLSWHILMTSDNNSLWKGSCNYKFVCCAVFDVVCFSDSLHKDDGSLTGDLTNHTAKSAILSKKQTRPCRWTRTWKMVCIDIFPWLKQDTFWCSFMFILCYVKRKRWSVHVPLKMKHYLSPHIKEPQNAIYYINFLKNEKIGKLRLCFIQKITCSVLSVSTLAVSSLLCKAFFTVWHERTMACREHSNSNLGKGSVLSSFTHPHVIRALWLSFLCGTEYCEECWFGDHWLPLCGQKTPHRDISQNIFCIPHKKVDHRGLKWHGMSKYWQNCWVNYPLRQSTSWTIKCSPTVQYKCAITLFIHHPTS